MMVILQSSLLFIFAGCRSVSQDSKSPTSSQSADVASIPKKLTTADIKRRLEALKSSLPADAFTSFEIGQLELKSGGFNAARATFRTAIEKFPQYARGRFLAGSLLLSLGEETEAKMQIDLALALDPRSVDALFLSALIDYRKKDNARAIVTLDKLLKIRPDHPNAYLLRAYCNDHHGTSLASISDLEHFLSLSPNPTVGQFMLGRIYSRLNQREKSEQYLKMAIASDAQNPSFYVALGRLYTEQFDKSRQTEGMDCFQKALTIDPKYADAHRYLGKALMSQGQYDGAVTHFKTALEQGNIVKPMLYELSQALAKSGKTAESADFLEKFKVVDAYEKGYDHLSRTVYSNPKSPNGYVNLAKFCIENRHPNAAIAVLKEMESQSKPTPESNAIKQRALEMIGGSQSKDANQRAPMTIFELMETGNG